MRVSCEGVRLARAGRAGGLFHFDGLSILTGRGRGSAMESCAAFLIGRRGPGRVPHPPDPKRGRGHMEKYYGEVDRSWFSRGSRIIRPGHAARAATT